MNQEDASARGHRAGRPIGIKDVPLLAAGLIAVILLVGPALGFLVVYFTWRILSGAWLGFLVRLRWYPQGKYMLFVYSNSPNWQEYIETNILPRIRSKAVLMNWSDRSQWRWEENPLEVRVFRHWTGVRRHLFGGKKKWDGNEHNPVAVTFIPWWRGRVFRFWQPFKDFKHGKEKPLKELEARLFRILEMAR